MGVRLGRSQLIRKWKKKVRWAAAGALKKEFPSQKLGGRKQTKKRGGIENG
ncbi:MAG: hypothetical protein AB1467_05225 [Candidatus Diapherotrites archaeon]